MAEPDNLVLILLREMREEMITRSETNARFDAIEQRLDRMEKRIEQLNVNGLKAMKGFVGHRSMVERAVAAYHDQLARLEVRMAALEAARP